MRPLQVTLLMSVETAAMPLLVQLDQNLSKTISFQNLRSMEIPVPETIHESLSRWKQFSNHSIIIHDQYDVDNYLSKTREDLPHIPNAAKCAIEAIAKYDLARLLILWDHGGIVVRNPLLLYDVCHSW